MKKFLKVLAVLSLIGAACAGIYIFLKKKGYFTDCDMDCENCDCDCACKDDWDDDEEEEEEDSFDAREYVSIQPKADAEEEASEEAAQEE